MKEDRKDENGNGNEHNRKKLKYWNQGCRNSLQVKKKIMECVERLNGRYEI